MAIESHNVPQRPALPFRWRTHVSLHLVFLGIAGAMIIASFVFSLEGENGVRIPGIPIRMPETCTAKRVWGVDCPGCGLTRSFVSMSGGEIWKAFGFNPAGPLVYLFVLVQIPWHLFQLARIAIGKFPFESFWLYVPIFVCSGALFLQWLYRMLS